MIMNACCCLQIRLRVPEIEVAMDAKEFQILQDVAAHLSAAQVRVSSIIPSPVSACC